MHWPATGVVRKTTGARAAGGHEPIVADSAAGVARTAREQELQPTTGGPWVLQRRESSSHSGAAISPDGRRRIIVRPTAPARTAPDDRWIQRDHSHSAKEPHHYQDPICASRRYPRRRRLRG